VLSFALAACSAPTGEASETDLRTKLRLTRPDWAKNLNVPADTSRALTADDFVGPDGRCPGDAPAEAGQSGTSALNFQAGPEGNAPAAPSGSGAPPAATQQFTRGISLQMSECEVIRALGNTGRVEISTDERGERTVVLTYLQGDRPGIYRFVSGRLKLIERAPEPPATAKPAPAKKSGKKPAAA
jgi:hypothetical protein